jgi:DNA (cytosine-5)-methyltransferase 1
VNVLDLFSGIGGFSLGLERAGFTTVAFCEIDPYARAVLAKHWPDVPCYTDVRTLTATRLAADGIRVDAICGGFPCQDISTAGRGAGLAGERSGLWREYARLVGELRPRVVFVENVSALLGRGFGVVLGDLAALGYDAEWHCIPASHVGAPHRRDRIWIVAHPNGESAERSVDPGPAERGEAATPSRSVESGHAGGSGSRPRQSAMADADEPRLLGEAIDAQYGRFRDQWAIEPGVGRVADGVPSRVDRLRCLGNAVVPQIPEIIGRAIMAADEATGAL